MHGMRAPDFYLSSGEHVGEWAKARSVYVVRVLHDNSGTAHLLVSVDPPVEHEGRRYPQVVVASHFSGWSIWPPARYPFPIYVYAPKTATITDSESFDKSAFYLMAWCELYETLADAERVAAEQRGK